MRIIIDNNNLIVKHKKLSHKRLDSSLNTNTCRQHLYLIDKCFCFKFQTSKAGSAVGVMKYKRV